MTDAAPEIAQSSPAEEPPAGAGARFPLGAIAAIVLAVVVVFFPILDHGFLGWDDPQSIRHNPALNPVTATSFIDAWRAPHMQLYIPVTYTVWGAVAVLAQATGADGAGDRPGLFHAASLLLHLGAALLVFALLRRLGLREAAAAVGAVLFAIHPVQVETVAWASGMKDVLAGLLVLAVLYHYAGFVVAIRGERPARLSLVLAGVFYGLALLAKPSAVAAPLLVGVLGVVWFRRPLREVAAIVGAGLLLAIPVALVARAVQPTMAIPFVTPVHLRPVIALDAVAFYVAKILAPVQLAFDYGRSPARVLAGSEVYASWIVPVAFGAGAWILWRPFPALAAGLGILVVAVAPVLGLVPFDFQSYSTVADHYLYVAMLGPALILAAILNAEAWSGRRPLVVAAALVVILGGRSAMAVPTWRDDMALFDGCLAVNPESVAANTNLALLVRADDPTRAEELLRVALATEPGKASTHHNLANVLNQLGRPGEALGFNIEATRLRPEVATFHFGLGNTLFFKLGRPREGAEAYARVIELEPEHVTAHLYLGMLNASVGRHDEAERLVARALEIDPESEEGQRIRVMIQEERRRAGQ